MLDQLDQKNLKIENRKSPIEPFATLVHFVLPNWLAKAGGWENPNTAYELENFTKKLLSKFGHRIKFWVTHNEPNIFLGFGYESGIWPPGKENDWAGYMQAYQGLLLGHQLAYKAIKSFNPNHQVGFAQNLYYFQALKEEDLVPNVVRSQLHNYAFIESCVEMNCLDFLGVNYYTRFSYKLNPNAKDPTRPDLAYSLWGELQDMEEVCPGEIQKNNLGWETYPEGLFKVLTEKKMKDTLAGRPVYITENGYCHIENNESLDLAGGVKASQGQGAGDLEDAYRIKYIQTHLIAVHKAIKEGVDIRGYFYWSLLDNFEWALGMKPRFGLIHVDHKNFTRTPKQSYYYYAEIAKNNGLQLTTKELVAGQCPAI